MQQFSNTTGIGGINPEIAKPGLSEQPNSLANSPSEFPTQRQLYSQPQLLQPQSTGISGKSTNPTQTTKTTKASQAHKNKNEDEEKRVPTKLQSNGLPYVIVTKKGGIKVPSLEDYILSLRDD